MPGSGKSARPQLTELDRAKIGEARDVLKKYGQYVDVAEMSDVAFEKRINRMKALDLAAGHGFGKNSDETVKIADKFYHYIWEGLADAIVDG